MQDSTPHKKILYLATTFPRFSETFLQREVSFLRTQHLQLDVRSLWGGSGIFEAKPIPTSNLRNLPTILASIPSWIVSKPLVFRHILSLILSRRLPMVQNWLENFWGFAWALHQADSIRRQPPDLIHATWGTMPAAAALALHQLTGLPYSMEAHAYDVFKYGGDWLLDEKMRHARFIRTSTHATREQLLETGANSDRLHLVRRGVNLKSKIREDDPRKLEMRILSVGRLVEKKDFLFQLEVFEVLAKKRVPFRAEIVGHGPLKEKLQRESQRRGLSSYLSFRGRLDYTQVEEAYHRSNIYLFTGKVARNGDRDGLPNVIAEAMLHQLLVLTSPAPGALEAIKDNQTGIIIPKDVNTWAETLITLYKRPNLDKIKSQARHWIQENFDISKNAAALGSLLIEHAD